MTEQEKNELAGRLADGLFTFENALRLVEMNPGEALRLIREDEERERKRKERKSALRELHLSRRGLF